MGVEAVLLLMAVLAGELTATLHPKDPYTVVVEYRLDPVAEPTSLGFTILEAKGARLGRVRVNESTVSLDRTRAPQLRGAVELPSGASVVTFRYEVTGTTIPVAVPVAGFDEARPNAFLATLRLPRGLHVVESFPTGLNESAEGHVLELPIVPAFVSLTLASERPWISFPALMDTVVLFVLGSIAVVTLRLR